MTSIAPGLSPAKVKRLEEQVAKRMKRFADNPRGKPMIAQPMPRPQIDEGFGNGPGRPNMPLAQPMPVTNSIQQMGGGMDGGFGGGMDGVGGMRRGGKVQKMASGGSASKRADGFASNGNSNGRLC
jgi:hypothetical protein